MMSQAPEIAAGARARPLMLALLLVTLPLVVQNEPAYRPSYVVPLSRSVHGLRSPARGQVQHIVHVPDSRDPLSGSSFGDRTGSHFGPVITISGFGGTITISPGPVTSTGTSTGTSTSTRIGSGDQFSVHADAGPDPGFVTSSVTDFGPHINSGGDVGSVSSDGNTFITSSVEGSGPNPHSGFEPEPHFTSGFVDGSNSNSKFLTESGFSSSFIDTPSSGFTTGSKPNSDISFSHGTISGPKQGQNLFGGPGPSFTSTVSNPIADTSFSHNFDVTSGGSFGDGRGGTGGTNFLPSSGFTSTSSGRAPGTSGQSDAKLPKTTVYGPNFGTLPGHSRRKTCATVVDLEAEFDLRLIPYNIPVVGKLCDTCRVLIGDYSIRTGQVMLIVLDFYGDLTYLGKQTVKHAAWMPF